MLNKEKDNFYRKYTNKDIDGLEKDTSIFTIFVEVASDGRVLREVGLDNDGKIVHKCPSKQYKYGTYGVFDLARIDVSNQVNDLSKEEFESLWKK